MTPPKSRDRLGREVHRVARALVAILLAWSAGATAIVLKVDPAGTYLFVDPNTFGSTGDSAAPPTSYTPNLDALARGGDGVPRIAFRRLGAFKPGQPFADDNASMIGVFANGAGGLVAPSFAVADSYNLFPVVTPGTHPRNLPTDVPQDFQIHDTWTIASVPAGATRVLFSALDSFFSDNTDPNGDYAVEIVSCQDVLSVKPQILTNGGAQIDAEFKPAFGVSVREAAALCGFEHLNWKQIIRSLTVVKPDGKRVPYTQQNCDDYVVPCKYLMRQGGSFLRAPPALIDPVPGGLLGSKADSYDWYYDLPFGQCPAFSPSCVTPAQFPDPYAAYAYFSDAPCNGAGFEATFVTQLFGVLKGNTGKAIDGTSFTWTYRGAKFSGDCVTQSGTIGKSGTIGALPSGQDIGSSTFEAFIAPDSLTSDEFRVLYDPARSQSLAFTPIPPCRLVDTRNAAGALPPRSARKYSAAEASRIAQAGGSAAGCNVPDDPPALALTLTAIAPPQDGNLVAYEADGSTPLASALNYLAGQIVANTTVVPTTPGAADHFALFNNSDGATHVVVDVVGYFRDYASPPCRKASSSVALGAGASVDVTAACAAGEVAVGGGCSASEANAVGWLDRRTPASGDGYRCTARNDSGAGVTVTTETMCCLRAGR